MLKEPLLHFALLGLGLFLLWGVLRADDRVLVVPAATVERLRADAARRLGHDPERAELDAAVDQHIADELLYREGLALGLDRADPVVRQRVIQKMRFLHEDLRAVPEPGEEELAAFAGERLNVPAQVAFEHVHYRGDGRSAAELDALVEAARGRLAAGEDPASVGEAFALGRAFTGRALPIVERDLGPDFAQAAADAPLGVWTRADTPYGAHLLRVTERSEPRSASPDELRAGATEEWKRQRRQEHADQALQELRDAATIRIER